MGPIGFSLHVQRQLVLAFNLSFIFLCDITSVVFSLSGEIKVKTKIYIYSIKITSHLLENC